VVVVEVGVGEEKAADEIDRHWCLMVHWSRCRRRPRAPPLHPCCRLRQQGCCPVALGA